MEDRIKRTCHQARECCIRELLKSGCVDVNLDVRMFVLACRRKSRHAFVNELTLGAQT